MKLLINTVLMTMLALTLGCRTTTNQAKPQSDDLANLELPEIDGHLFIGCRDNAGECRTACGEHLYRQMTEESKYCATLTGSGGLYECHCAVEE